MVNTMNRYYLAHHGIKGQKWGVRRYQNEDGTLTEEGKIRKNRNRKLLIGAAAALTAVGVAAYYAKNRKKIDGTVSDFFTQSLYDRGIMERKISAGEKFVKDIIENSKTGYKEGMKSIPKNIGEGIKSGIGNAAKGGPQKLIKTVGVGATMYAGKKALDKMVSKQVASEIYKYGKAKEK